jgi:hypothetical protein
LGKRLERTNLNKQSGHGGKYFNPRYMRGIWGISQSEADPLLKLGTLSEKITKASQPEKGKSPLCRDESDKVPTHILHRYWKFNNLHRLADLLDK